MKICDITQFYSPVSGGVKRYLHEKVKYLHAASPSDEHLLIIPGEKDDRWVEGRSTVCTIRSPLLSRSSGYRFLIRLGAIDEILKIERPDLIEVGDPYQVGWKSIFAGRRFDVPVVGFYHSHFSEAYVRYASKRFSDKATERLMRWARGYTRALYGRLEKTLVPSPALAEVLKNWGVENTECVDLGVDTAIFRPKAGEAEEVRETRRGLKVEEDEVLALYVGRLAQEKNTQTLFAAFECLLSQGQDKGIRLMVVGDGLQRGAIQALQQRFPKVIWVPYCSDPEQLARWYRAADLFIHPGVQETFGLVALESQACGTPVVGIRGGYMDRIIFSSQATWACENTSEALSEAIRQTVETAAAGEGAARGGLALIGEAASQEVRGAFGWNQVFTRLFGIYRSTIAAYKSRDV